MRLRAVALARLRRRWPFSVAVGAGLVVVVALATATTTVRTLAEEAGLAASVRGLGTGALVTVSAWPVDSETGVQGFRSALADARSGARAALTVNTVSVSTSSVPARSGAAGPAALLAMDGLRAHVVPVAGTLDGPAGVGSDWYVTASQAAAARLGMTVGQRACFAQPTPPQRAAQQPTGPPAAAPQPPAQPQWCARLAGIWQPRDPREPFWQAAGPLAGFLTVPEDELFAVLGPVAALYRPTAGAVLEPHTAAMTLAGLPDLANQVRRLRERLTLEGARGMVDTNLDGGLDDYGSRLAVGEFALGLVSAQVLLVGLAYLAIASHHSLAQQGPALAVWRARGIGRATILRLLALEWVALAAAAMPVGLVAGLGAGALAGRVLVGGGLPPQLRADLPLALLAPVGIVVAASLAVLAVVSVLASRRELLDLRRRASRPGGAWWQARGADIGLAALCVPLVGATQLLGTAQLRALGLGDAGMVSLILPGLALLFAALALLRLLPAAGWLARRWARHPVFALAARNLERRPLEHAPVALLLIAAVALGVFSGAYANSEQRNVADRVAYGVGADVRATAVAASAAPPAFGLPARLPGVRVATPVYRDRAAVGGLTTSVSVLGVDPTTVTGVAWDRPGLLGTTLASAMGRMGSAERDGVTLPGRPDQLLLWANGGGRSLTLSAAVDDARGRHCTVNLGAAADSWGQLAGPIRCPAAPAYPLRLRALAVAYGTVSDDTSLALSDLTVAGPTGTTVIEPFREEQGWWASSIASGQNDGDLAVSGVIPRGNFPTAVLDVPAVGGTSFIRPFPGGAPVPALANGATLDDLGITPGRPFFLNMGTGDMMAEVVGQVNLFPTLYPQDGDFLVVDQSALLDHLLYSDDTTPQASELWAAVDPQHEGAAVAALGRLPGVNAVADRQQQTAAALADPVDSDLRANLVVGFWAAALLALAGFAVHVVVTARGRLGESAILQANGLPAGAVERSVLLEHGLVLLFGAVAGAVLGLALAWALVPSLELQTGASQTVPPSLLILDPALTAVAAAAVPAAALLLGWASGRAAGRVALMRELRGLG
jgi:hypothetical protein